MPTTEPRPTLDEQVEAGARALHADCQPTTIKALGFDSLPEPSKNRFRRWARVVLEARTTGDEGEGAPDG